jgi:BMFP domain-containing protein YqiC
MKDQLKKEVKIIGLSVNKSFGGLKATELKFNEENRLTVVKGEVGSGKTTLNRALSLTTKGSKTLEDNNLYGEVDLTAQLLDGDYKVFVNCKTDQNGKLIHSIYTIDEHGNKLKDVVIDGQKLTPANYLKSLQTSLTWRLDELTSENPVTQRKILLELYSSELEKKGVIFDKNHPKFTESIIHKIEVSKNDRNYADMKRKEVGGIAEDLKSKGIDYETVRELKDVITLEQQISAAHSDINYLQRNAKQVHEAALNELKTKGLEINAKLKDFRDKIKDSNDVNQEELNLWEELQRQKTEDLDKIQQTLESLESNNIDEVLMLTHAGLPIDKKPKNKFLTQLEFNEKGQCTSQPEDFQDEKINQLLKAYIFSKSQYSKKAKQEDIIPDTSKQEEKIAYLKDELNSNYTWNKEAKAINSFHDWKDANEIVKDLKNDYYKKLTGIDTGVDGLHISLENAESENIFLMYDGAYDTEYFHNPEKELRKLSSYSDTQKPLICLLIQNYLLKQKGKSMPYLWIDKVPIDKKTRLLLNRMSEELGLWLFVSWTGDFEKANLVDGELLIENGDVFFSENK